MKAKKIKILFKNKERERERSRIGKSMETGNRSVVAKGWRAGGNEE